MALNTAEAQFFELCRKYFEANPPKLLSEQSIDDFRASANIFLEYTGKSADINYTEKTISDEKLNIYHQILLNGCYDLTQSNHEYDDYEKEDKICTRDAADFIFSQYGIPKSEFINPLFSPYYEKNLANLPPTTFIIGEYDGLRNDSEGYYQKVKSANNHIEKIMLPGQTHNTLIMRAVMSDGPDPAEVIATVIKKYHPSQYQTINVYV